MANFFGTFKPTDLPILVYFMLLYDMGSKQKLV